MSPLDAPKPTALLRERARHSATWTHFDEPPGDPRPFVSKRGPPPNVLMTEPGPCDWLHTRPEASSPEWWR